MIPTIDYKEWFLNQKKVPDKESAEYEAFYDFHKNLCATGFYMGDTFFNPFLYWHLNFWHTEVDIVDPITGKINQKYANPYLRDNEWLVTNEIHRAEQERKGLVILGIRRFSKSVLAASYMAMGATFDQDSQNVISGLNAGDIKLITDKIDKGLGYIPDAWKWQRIEDNWKTQVTLGVKGKKGERYPFSQILIRNLDEGNNEEAIAGTKPRKLLIDEIGKGSFLRGLQAAEPGFTTPFGWAASPILTGTGGAMEKFMDAKSLFFDVDKFNFLTYNNSKDNRRIHGLFIGAKYRMEAKEESNMADFLEKEDENLKQIPILISNEEKALEITKTAIEKKRKAGDKLAYLKERMYYPIEVDDIFLNSAANMFSTEGAQSQQRKLHTEGITGTPIEIYHDGEKLTHKFTDKEPITEFPLKSQLPDGCVVMYEPPIPNAPFGLYVAGIDPYKSDKAAYSDSLGAVYIYKRMHNITDEKYQDMIVAHYVGRPESRLKWNETTRNLIKYYNALALSESEDMGFIDYMIERGDSMYLMEQPAWLKEITPHSKVDRTYGIPATVKIINHLNSLLKSYTEEVINVVKDDKGAIIREVVGFSQILDTVLLEEIVQFNPDGNFDRIRAASIAIAVAKKLDAMHIVPSSKEQDPRLQAYFKKDKSKSTNLLLGSSNQTPQKRKSKINRLLS